MEMRTVALLVFIVSGVCGTPYGYGVKGGAAAGAKAEARAIAGPFAGGAPVQPGPGYSGSYSKSSSSSFASSSASSSASSFSFSGSVPPEFDHKSLENGGCTGGCKNNNDKTSPHYGSAPNSNSQTNAAAFAGATAGSGAFPKINNNCGGKDCSKDSAPCSGEDCSNNKKQCTSGQCNNSVEDGSNDISSNVPKTSGPEGYSGPDCVNGNCGSTTPYHAESNKPTNQYSSSAGTSPTPVYSTAPSTYLETPKQPCDSPNCGSPKEKRPSSYNVPISSVLSEPSKPCTNGNCNNQESSPSSNLSSNQYLSPSCSTPGCVKPPTNHLQAPNTDVSSDCGSSGSCNTGRTEGYDIGPIAKAPKVPTPPTHTFSYTPSSGNPSGYSQTIPHSPVPSKSPQPSYVNLPESEKEPSFVALNEPATPFQNQPLNPGSHLSSPSYVFGSSTPLRPSYAPVNIYPNMPPHLAGGYQQGAFGPIGSTGTSYVHTPSSPGCGSAGCGIPSSYPGSTHLAPNFGNIQPPCKTPGCNTQSGLGANVPPKAPPYSGGFGGPSGLLKPNEFTGSSNVPLNQKPIPAITPASTGPAYGSAAPTGCTSGNCATSPGYGGNFAIPTPCKNGDCAFGTDPKPVHTGNDNHSPEQGILNGFPSNCASGNCGNQLPNHNGVALGQNIPGHGGITGGLTPCASGNCNQAPNYGVSAGSAKPGYGGIVGGPIACTSGNCKQPQNNYGIATGPSSPDYVGIVGSASPCTSGNCKQTPNNLATAGSNSAGYGGVVGSSPCASGNCNQVPDHNAAAAGMHIPVHGGIEGNPASCTTGNCNPHGGATGSSISASASANAVAYTGGFGGPPGILSPYDNGKFVGKDAAGKLLVEPGSGGQYGAATNGANSGTVGGYGSGGYGGGLNDDAHGSIGHESGKHSGCNSGCGGGGDSGVAAAKAYSGATSAADAKGYGASSYAGSSASAHASSGAHTKGGYSG